MNKDTLIKYNYERRKAVDAEDHKKIEAIDKAFLDAISTALTDARLDELYGALDNPNDGSHGISKYYVRRRIRELKK